MSPNSNNDDLSNSQNEENALWSIVGYLLSGLLIWGGIGWGVDQWLGTTYFLLVGLLLGAGLVIFSVASLWARLRSPNLTFWPFLSSFYPRKFRANPLYLIGFRP